MIKYIRDVNVLNTCQFNKLGSKNLIQPNVDENSVLMVNSMKKMGVFLIMTVENWNPKSAQGGIPNGQKYHS
jgi:hypothetical protein